MSATATKGTEAGRHARSGETMTGADKIIQVLVDQGVDTIFGYSGGAILPTYDAVFRYNQQSPDPDDPIRLVVPANEQGAGFMAAGYARATGKCGVALVTSGPGATNAVTPVRDCMADSIPMIVLCGQVPRAAMGTDAFQEAPVYNIMSACSKHTFLVTEPEELEATIRTAFEVALSGRPGPVVIDIPKDVQNYKSAFVGEGLLDWTQSWRERVSEVVGAQLTEDQVDRFLKMLAESKRPLIYAGGGVINADASKALKEFSHTFGIPVTTTLMGIGAIDTAEALSLHMLGMHGTACANYGVEDCDFLIAIGARFDDRVAGKVQDFAPGVKAIAHLDIDAAEIGKVKAATWHHVGDMSKALDTLREAARSKDIETDFSDWQKHVEELKKTYRLNYDRNSPMIQPYYVIECLNDVTKGEAIIATGVGQHQMWAAQYAYIKHPRNWLTSGSMGTMGFGLPAAIGAQAACPGKLVIDIDGDGSLRMNLGEMETATTYNLPVKILLLNNMGDGMVRQWQKLYFGERFSGSDKSLHRKDFVKAAEADGFGFCKRLTVYEKEKVPATLKEFCEYEGPAFLEVMIDPDANVFPMVGPGMGYKEMVTGKWIKSRKAGEQEKPKADDDDSAIPELF